MTPTGRTEPSPAAPEAPDLPAAPAGPWFRAEALAHHHAGGDLALSAATPRPRWPVPAAWIAFGAFAAAVVLIARWPIPDTTSGPTRFAPRAGAGGAVEITAFLPAADGARLRAGMAVTLRTATDARPRRGTLTAIAPTSAGSGGAQVAVHIACPEDCAGVGDDAGVAEIALGTRRLYELVIVPGGRR